MKLVKKLFALLMLLALCLSLAACDGDKPAPGVDNAGPAASSSGAVTGGDKTEPAVSPSDAETDGEGSGTDAPSDFSSVTSYTEIPILADREPFEATPIDILQTSWWNYYGGCIDGRELDEAEIRAVQEQYNYVYQLRFQGTSDLSMVRNEDSVDGHYKIGEDNQTITMTFDDHGTTRNYVGVFTWPDQMIVMMVLVSEEEPSTAIYFVMDEG